MILADKIMNLRKKNGWSQEELAEMMKVSRQSVSKWESAQSVPDLDKILQLSQIFGVSTDYLLMDEMEAEEFVNTPDEFVPPVKRVSMEEANKFLEYRKGGAPKLALGVSLCVMSPITLLVLAGLADAQKIISENIAAAIGLGVLLLFVACAVYFFVSNANAGRDFEYLEKEVFESEYGVAGMVEEKKKAYATTFNRNITIGVVLCILGVIPFLVVSCMTENSFYVISALGVLLLFVAAAVNFFVSAGFINDGFTQLLQENDYDKKKKGARQNPVAQAVTSIYWCVVIAGYLTWSFLTNDWRITWIVWPIAVFVYAIIHKIMDVVAYKNETENR